MKNNTANKLFSSVQKYYKNRNDNLNTNTSKDNITFYKALFDTMNSIKSEIADEIFPQYAELQANILLKLGNSYLTKGQPNNAAKCYNNILKNHNSGEINLNAKDNDKVCYKLSDALLQIYHSTQKTGYLKKAAIFYTRISTYKDKEFLDEMLEVGNQCYKANIFDEAFACYTKLIEQNYSQKDAAYYNMGNLYMALEIPDYAAECYKSALEINHDNTDYCKATLTQEMQQQLGITVVGTATTEELH